MRIAIIKTETVIDDSIEELHYKEVMTVERICENETEVEKEFLSLQQEIFLSTIPMRSFRIAKDSIKEIS
jgi:hypothetical protein